MAAIGKRVGRYELAGLIGKGGMGVVYRAVDADTGAQVALKNLSRTHPSALLRFKQEFRALADISHPHLVTLYELFAAGDEWWLAMELVHGIDWISFVRATPATWPSDSADDVTQDLSGHSGPVASTAARAGHGSLPSEQVPRLRAALTQLVTAIRGLHAHDIVHCDVKPSNVMVDLTGRTVLLDFGLVTPTADAALLRHAREVAGTVGYMAPEQVSGRQLSPATDWYAVGVMLYQVLAGRLPFDGTIAQVMQQKVNGRWVPLRTLDPSLPEDVVALSEALMRTDPTTRPTGREVLAALGAADVDAEAIGDAPLIGREAHVTHLRTSLARVRQGATVTAFVRGRSGAGKSRLVRDFIDELSRMPSVAILSGRCYEDESVPYKAVDGLIDALARLVDDLPSIERRAVTPRNAATLARVFPVLRDVGDGDAAPVAELADPQEIRRRAFRALRELLARLGERRLLVLHVDDLQWGDVDSAALLAELLRPPGAPAALFIAAYRSEHEQKSVCVRRLLRDYRPGTGRLAVTVDVGALDGPRAVDLALALLPAGIPEARRHAVRIARESGGLPFFIHELAQHSTGLATAELELPAAPADLDDLVRRRVGALPGAQRELLELVALSGTPITRRALQVASGHPDRGVLRQLRTARLVRTTGSGDTDWVEPYHDRIREAVTRRLSPEASRELHGRLALSLESTGDADPESLAQHFQHGGHPERAGAYYVQAADAAANALAFERAARLYGRALALHTGSAHEAARLREQLADALANSGRGAEAAHAYLAAADGGSADGRLDLQRKAAYQFCVSGHLHEGRSTLKRLLGAIGVGMPERRTAVIGRLLYERAKLRVRGLTFRPRVAADVPPAALLESDLTWAAAAGLSMFDVVAGAAFGTRNLNHALATGEPSRVARAVAWEAAQTSNAGVRAWPRTARLLSMAHDLAEHVDDPHARGLTALASGIAEFTMGRWSSARDRLLDASDVLRTQCRGVAWELDTAYTFELWARIYAGDLRSMAARTDVLLKEAYDRGDLYAETHLGTFMEPHARLVDGRPAEAAAAVDRALERWRLEGYHLQHMTALMMRVYIDLYEGRGHAALDRLLTRRAWVRAGFYDTIQVLRVFWSSLEGRAGLLVASQGPGKARGLAVAQRAVRRLERERVAWAVPLARVLRAGLDVHAGRIGPAVTGLETAAAEFNAVPMDGYAAAARWRAAHLLRSGPRADALRYAADVWHTRESVQDPDRMAAMSAFGDPA